MDRYNGKLCRPREEKLYMLSSGFSSIVIALKPTQKWMIQERTMHTWYIKRKNVVLALTDDDFLALFYRTNR